MTGFGAGAARGEAGTATVEIKTLNNRFCDVALRLPREMNALEPTLRERAARRLVRGKAEIAVRWEPAAARLVPGIRREVLRAFHEQWEALRDEAPGLPPLDARALLSLPGALEAPTDEGGLEAAAGLVERAFDDALEAVVRARATEGERLAADMKERVALLEGCVAELEGKRAVVVERYRAKLHERWQQISESTGIVVDPGRLEAEAMALADKADVTEELVRLRAHLDAFAALVAPGAAEPCGKPIDFLLQEFFREFNTIGSKARDADVTAIVLRAKHELEKLREQSQNLV